jgi:hypothetical protein
MRAGVAGIDALQGNFEEEEGHSLRKGVGIVCGEPLAWHWFVPVPRPSLQKNNSSRNGEMNGSTTCSSRRVPSEVGGQPRPHAD